MVDEDQDTNGVQETIINDFSSIMGILCGDDSSVCRVIVLYLWRNITPMGVICGRALYRPENFRSHENILAVEFLVLPNHDGRRGRAQLYTEAECLAPGRIVEGCAKIESMVTWNYSLR